eukprot:CAMPEP_0170519558 /NCGR_PEP_ID=MMETSP0209-20121228/4933_1 /TAXON_ID=665100 ORGANISM="Litonotus pictus, Strain P1" /NCGR_SAMPLE_ID=MMETSP0209 /ASSEMBLY_ACC=CAM_ASM_000301 /LENGTH=398 /DNA_ID=CAMNT_0010805475 /DNA_START=123 /DNA_END=1319 /DNA_ORIENTATION=-
MKAHSAHILKKLKLDNSTHQAQSKIKAELKKVLSKSSRRKQEALQAEVFIETIETNILINSNNTDGLVTEIVKYRVPSGSHKKIVRKIPIDGTSEELVDFKLVSSDVRLLGAQIVKNCGDSGSHSYESKENSVLDNSFSMAHEDEGEIRNSQKSFEWGSFGSNDVNNQHPYICVIANFEEIQVSNLSSLEPKSNQLSSSDNILSNPMNSNKIDYSSIIIGYEYTAKHLLKRREKPFSSSDQQENVMIWLVSNSYSHHLIDRVELTVKINNKVDSDHISIYPEKFSQKLSTHQGVQVSWETRDIKPKASQNYILNLPLFNSQCKQMNEIRLELNKNNIMQIIFGVLLMLSFLSFLIYLYVSATNKSFKKDLFDSNKNITSGNNAHLSSSFSQASFYSTD